MQGTKVHPAVLFQETKLLLLSRLWPQWRQKKKKKTHQTKLVKQWQQSLGWDNDGSTAASSKAKGEFRSWNWVKTQLCLVPVPLQLLLGQITSPVQGPTQHNWLMGVCTDPEQKLQEVWTAHPKKWQNQLLTSTVHYYLADQREIFLSKKMEEMDDDIHVFSEI